MAFTLAGQGRLLQKKTAEMVVAESEQIAPHLWSAQIATWQKGGGIGFPPSCI